MEGEEIFGSYKRKVNLTPKSEGDLQRHNRLIFSHPRVNHTIAKSSVEIEQSRADQIQGDVQILEGPCRNGFWHIERCPLMSHVQCSTLQKSTKHYFVVRIIANLTSTGVPASTFSGLWFQFPSAPLKLHKF